LKPSRNNAGLAVLTAAAVMATAACALGADKIRTVKGVGYVGLITGVGADGLVIAVEDVKKIVPISEIARVTSDKYLELERAETAYAKGDAKGLQEAEKIYTGLLRESGAADWLRVLVQYRMFKVYADSGRVAEALDAYLAMARAGPRIVDGLKLPAADPGAREANKAMLEKVDAAIEGAAGKPYVAELKTFRTGLILHEGTPEEVQKALDAALASDDAKVRQSAQLKQVELLVTGGKIDDAAARLEEYAGDLVGTFPADLAYWRGRVLLEQKKYTEAALALMRVPVLYPAKDRTRTAESLWRAGQAMEAAKMSRPDIVKVYTEAVQQYAGTPGADSARKELARLGAAK
jgi:hypothetical protein